MQMTIEQRNEFIDKNAGIIGDIIKKKNYHKLAKRSGYEYDDVYNSGVIGMIEGIEKYDINKATKENGDVVPLEAFVRNDVLRTMSAFIATPRLGDRFENKVSLQHKVGHDEGKDVTVEDMLASEEHTEEYGASIDRENIRALLESDILTDVEKLVIDERFMKGKKLREINEVLVEYLGNPKAKAFYFIGTAMDKLRNALAV